MRSVFLFTVIGCASFALAQPQQSVTPPIGASPYTVKLQPLVTGLNAPTDLTTPPDGSGRLMISQVRGVVNLYKNGALQATPFLDITSSTFTDPINYGLVSTAFHPGFNNPLSPGYRKLYTVSTEAPGTATANYGYGIDHQDVLYEWKASAANPDVVDTSTKREILRIAQPRPEHNMDQAVFGPDGFLYLGLGDGGNGTLYSPNAKMTDQPFGKIFRINVDDTSGNGRYSIPASNPFANSSTALKEIYSYGHRNPYRLSFDQPTGKLIVGDVGQFQVEEVDNVVLGGNYGWDLKEGSFIYNINDGSVSPDPGHAYANANNLIDPIGEYDHTQGSADIGGFVYHGSMLPQLEGKYIFGDLQQSFTQGNLMHGRLLEMDLASGLIRELQIDPSGSAMDFDIYGFGQNATGELYVLGRQGFNYNANTGVVMQIVPEPSSALLVAAGTLALALRRRRAD